MGAAIQDHAPAPERAAREITDNPQPTDNPSRQLLVRIATSPQPSEGGEQTADAKGLRRRKTSIYMLLTGKIVSKGGLEHTFK